MGFWEAIADLAESVAPWSVAEAEAPAEDSKVRQIISSLPMTFP